MVSQGPLTYYTGIAGVKDFDYKTFWAGNRGHRFVEKENRTYYCGEWKEQKCSCAILNGLIQTRIPHQHSCVEVWVKRDNGYRGK